MDEQVRNGILAILAGGFAGFLLFVPFVAVSYRRRGRLTAGRAVLWALALVYFWAIWTYTLLPLPDPDTMRCAGVNLDIWAFIDDVRGAARRPGPFVTDPAILQLVLNVLLFVPLGFFLRVLGGRGILVALLVGLGTSAFVETTQVTGVWGIHPCAYRVFDVDDMLTNTLGAVAGSLFALVVPSRLRGVERAADADVPRPVTRRRRALGMLCDAVGLGLVISAVGIVVQLWLQFVVGDREAVLDSTPATVSGLVVGTGLWLAVILVTGRSVGDLAVRLRFSGGVLPTWLARPVRWITGVSGYTLLDALPDPWSLLALPFVVATAVMLFAFRDGRGLPGVFGARVVDEREASARVE
ncbi:VanZ family protein [Microbacterium hatanonis]|uniref:VanZ family protein n=1 Tax=Microbacterium hatanonis TaxID=404366 RepID=A0A5C8HX12_9MICO|nr:VanZ family protein [Microbacterium hatanonis]TXK09486.1 VanZ family protein [Microbacterium hatanonis]